ncbi:MAG TPA: TIGR00303 family protein [Allocoleopsis sp.]
MLNESINIYTEFSSATKWLNLYQGKIPTFTCILGFTHTGLIPGISAAGKTPEDRKYTAIADAEFLYYGDQTLSKYPLPPLTGGVSPVYISRSAIANLSLPLYIFNAGLLQSPNIPHIDLKGLPAQCLTTGKSLPIHIVKHLFNQGLEWGEKLGKKLKNSYLIISECVVGGTTTALAVLTALGIDAKGKINSSHPNCNHNQKWELVQTALKNFSHTSLNNPDPLEIIAAMGDPMQIVAAGRTITASRYCGVLLAGGTQMLAVYALIQSITKQYELWWQPEQVVIGTTRWVAEDFTGDTIGLTKAIGLTGKTPILLGTKLNFSTSHYPQLQIYEQGYVKEGVGAGGSAIAAHLLDWNQTQLIAAIETLLQQNLINLSMNAAG